MERFAVVQRVIMAGGNSIEVDMYNIEKLKNYTFLHGSIKNSLLFYIYVASIERWLVSPCLTFWL